MWVYFVWYDIRFSYNVRLAKQLCVGTGQRSLHLKNGKISTFIKSKLKIRKDKTLH